MNFEKNCIYGCACIEAESYNCFNSVAFQLLFSFRELT